MRKKKKGGGGVGRGRAGNREGSGGLNVIFHFCEQRPRSTYFRIPQATCKRSFVHLVLSSGPPLPSHVRPAPERARLPLSKPIQPTHEQVGRYPCRDATKTDAVCTIRGGTGRHAGCISHWFADKQHQNIQGLSPPSTCVCLSASLSSHPSVYPPVCLPIRLSICLPIRPSVCLPAFLPGKLTQPSTCRRVL